MQQTRARLQTKSIRVCLGLLNPVVKASGKAHGQIHLCCALLPWLRQRLELVIDPCKGVLDAAADAIKVSVKPNLILRYGLLNRRQEFRIAE